MSTQVKLINIASEQRTSGSSTNFYYTLSTDVKVNSIDLLQAHVPLTFYNVTAPRTLNTGLGVIVFPAGSYSKQDAVTKLLALLLAVNINFTAQLDANTLFVTVGNTVNFSLPFLTAGASDLAALLGFSYTDFSGASTYTATGVGVVFPSNLILVIPELGLIGIASSRQSTFTYLIPVAPFIKGDWVIYTANTTYQQKTFDTPKLLKSFNVALLDFNGQPVDLHGAEFDFLLGIK